MLRIDLVAEKVATLPHLPPIRRQFFGTGRGIICGCQTLFDLRYEAFFFLAQRVRRYDDILPACLPACVSACVPGCLRAYVPACLQDVRCEVEGMQREKANATSDFDAQMQVGLTETWWFRFCHSSIPAPPLERCCRLKNQSQRCLQ